jgi:hypothetical protein
MAHIFKKYAFASKEEAISKIEGLGLNEEGQPVYSHIIVELGHIVKVAGEYDEEGNELVAPILSDKYAVDVLWTQSEITNIISEAVYSEEGELISAEVSEVAFPEGWEASEVFPEGNGVHTFAGWSFASPESLVN